MKNTMLGLALTVAGVLYGCQKSGFTNPDDGAFYRNVTDKTMSESGSSAVNALVIEGILHEPGIVHNSFVMVSGSAAYQATRIPPNPQEAILLRLTVSAELRPYPLILPPFPIPQTVSGTWEDLVHIPESGTAYVTKRLLIHGRNDGMILALEFQITLSGVESSGMWLELPRRVVPAATN